MKHLKEGYESLKDWNRQVDKKNVITNQVINAILKVYRRDQGSLKEFYPKSVLDKRTAKKLIQTKHENVVLKNIKYFQWIDWEIRYMLLEKWYKDEVVNNLYVYNCIQGRFDSIKEWYIINKLLEYPLNVKQKFLIMRYILHDGVNRFWLSTKTAEVLCERYLSENVVKKWIERMFCKYYLKYFSNPRMVKKELRKQFPNLDFLK